MSETGVLIDKALGILHFKGHEVIEWADTLMKLTSKERMDSLRRITALENKLKEARKLIGVAFNCKGADHWADNELKMLQWLDENRDLK